MTFKGTRLDYQDSLLHECHLASPDAVLLLAQEPPVLVQRCPPAGLVLQRGGHLSLPLQAQGLEYSIPRGVFECAYCLLNNFDGCLIRC